MAEVDANAYAVTGANAAAGASNSIETQQPGASGALRQVTVTGDAVTRANLQTVKAASTAATATDMGAVVHLHPTSPLPASTTGVTLGSVGITDGTNIAAVLASGTANASGNGVLTAQTSQSQTWSVTSVIAGTSYDVGNYKSVSVHVVAQYTGTTPTITFQSSNDNVNWVSNGLMTAISTGSSSGSTATTSTGIFEGTLKGRYFRLNFTGVYTSGTSTGVIVFSTASSSTLSGVVDGRKSNNTVIPGGTNLGVLPVVANAAVQTYTDTFQTTLSSDLAGNVRTVAPAATATLTSVASSATTVSLVAANNPRKGLIVFNESTAILYIAFAATSSLTAYTEQVASNTTWRMPTSGVYNGAISGIWSAANGSARITELT